MQDMARDAESSMVLVVGVVGTGAMRTKYTESAQAMLSSYDGERKQRLRNDKTGCKVLSDPAQFFETDFRCFEIQVAIVIDTRKIPDSF